MSRDDCDAYMSWGDTRGFTTHWDDHDVLIFQIFGRKNWFIFDDTRKFPLYKDLHDQHNPPLIHNWNQIIQTGDILFIPRGKWHHAVALNEPSFHLTFGFGCRTGQNYMQWLQNKLTSIEGFRRDIPAFASEEEINAFNQELTDMIAKGMKEYTLSSYLCDSDIEMEHRPHFSLPWGIKTATTFENRKIILNVGIIVGYEHDVTKKTISFSAKYKSYELSDSCDFLFKLLMDYKSHPFLEIARQTSENIQTHQLQEMLTSLIKDGLIAIVE